MYPITNLPECPYLLMNVKVEENFLDYLQVTNVVTVLEAQKKLCRDRFLNRLQSCVIKIILNANYYFSNCFYIILFTTISIV
jgi:hypothetical protein